MLTLPDLRKVANHCREPCIVECVCKIKRESAKKPEGIDGFPVAVFIKASNGKATDVYERFKDCISCK